MIGLMTSRYTITLNCNISMHILFIHQYSKMMGYSIFESLKSQPEKCINFGLEWKIFRIIIAILYIKIFRPDCNQYKISFWTVV